MTAPSKSLLPPLAVAIALILGTVINISDASAITVTTDLKPTGQSWDVGTDVRCSFLPSGGSWTIVAGNLYGECLSPPITRVGFSSLGAIYKNSPIHIVKGNYYVTYFQASELANNVAFGTIDSVSWNLNVPEYFDIVEFREVASSQDSPPFQGTSTQAASSTIYNVVLQAKSTGNYQFMLGNLSHSPQSLSVYSGNPQFSLSGIYEYVPSDVSSQLDEMNNKHDQEIDDQQQAVDNANGSSDDSQSDVDNSTSSLLDIIGSFISAISSASPSSCVINFSYGSKFSEPLDLCSLDPPAPITALLSITMCFISFGLAYSVVTQIVNIIRSFQS